MTAKTVFINCSPKNKLSVSGFIMKCAGLFIKGEKVYTHLRTPADRQPILDELKNAANVVFVTPLYVDSLPSHVLPFLKELETQLKQDGSAPKLYAIANNGFIEGRQNEPLMQVLENFCTRSGAQWRGGVGIGGGVMLNVTRIMLTVVFGITLVNMLLNAVQGLNVLEPLLSFGSSLLINMALCCGIIAYLLNLVWHINRGANAGKKYTRIMLPSFVFILFADAFFIIISVLQGGFFRGWLTRHLPDSDSGTLKE